MKEQPHIHVIIGGQLATLSGQRFDIKAYGTTWAVGHDDRARCGICRSGGRAFEYSPAPTALGSFLSHRDFRLLSKVLFP